MQRVMDKSSNVIDVEIVVHTSECKKTSNDTGSWISANIHESGMSHKQRHHWLEQ